jgi:hypothetical protein
VFHPLAPNVSELKDDELYAKITELGNKMNSAYRLGSGDVLRQMQMIMAGYQEELSRRNTKKLEEMTKNNPKFDKIIDIK